jgi:hypothetical protein
MTWPSGSPCPRCEAPNPAGQAFCGSCGLELGAEPAPSTSRLLPAGPAFDLLRARNIYAVVIVTVIVLLAVTAAGWFSQSSGSSAVAPTSPRAASTPAPTATPAPSPTPLAPATPAPSAPVAVATPAPSATPAPTPTVAQLAAAYLKAATVVNKANGAASTTWDASGQTLTDAKRLATARAAAELAYIRAVQKIPWYGDSKTLARRVLTADNQQYVSYRSAMVSKTWVAFKVSRHEADTANRQASAASNELRIALGLPPVPDLGR